MRKINFSSISLYAAIQNCWTEQLCKTYVHYQCHMVTFLIFCLSAHSNKGVVKLGKDYGIGNNCYIRQILCLWLMEKVEANCRSVTKCQLQSPA